MRRPLPVPLAPPPPPSPSPSSPPNMPDTACLAMPPVPPASSTLSPTLSLTLSPILEPASLTASLGLVMFCSFGPSLPFASLAAPLPASGASIARPAPQQLPCRPIGRLPPLPCQAPSRPARRRSPSARADQDHWPYVLPSLAPLPHEARYPTREG